MTTATIYLSWRLAVSSRNGGALMAGVPLMLQVTSWWGNNDITCSTWHWPIIDDIYSVIRHFSAGICRIFCLLFIAFMRQGAKNKQQLIRGFALEKEQRRCSVYLFAANLRLSVQICREFLLHHTLFSYVQTRCVYSWNRSLKRQTPRKMGNCGPRHELCSWCFSDMT